MQDSRHIPGLVFPGVMLRIVGIACILLALQAILYTINSAVVVTTGGAFTAQTPYAVHFFTAFVFVVIVMQIFVLFCGSQLLKLRTNVRGMLLGISVAVVLVFFGVGLLWAMTSQQVARSAAAATGIGLGGLSLYLVTLFPIWAPAITYWAHGKLAGSRKARRAKGLCEHCGYDMVGSTEACPECGLRTI